VRWYYRRVGLNVSIVVVFLQILVKFLTSRSLPQIIHPMSLYSVRTLWSLFAPPAHEVGEVHDAEVVRVQVAAGEAQFGFCVLLAHILQTPEQVHVRGETQTVN
jgi:hypothetical protein